MEYRFWGICMLAILGLGTTCERSIDLPFDRPASNLVVVSNFTREKQLEVRVSSSRSILEASIGEYLPDARVELFSDGEFMERLELVIPAGGRIPPYYQTRNVDLNTGITYQIRVDVTGFNPVTASSKIPEPVPIQLFQVNDARLVLDQSPMLKRYSYGVRFNFQDPEDNDDYYHLNFYQQVMEYFNREGDTVISRKILYPLVFNNTNNNNVINAYFSGGILMKNNPFPAGLSFETAFEVEPEFELLGDVFVELRTVSEEYYLFHTSLSRQQAQPEGPLNEPVIVFDNVDNGYGIFAGYNFTLDSVRLGL
jgi:hypothetical protein